MASCIEMNDSKENTLCSHAFTCRHISILGTLFLLLRDVVASDRVAWGGCFSRWRVGCSVVNIPSFCRVYRAINLCQVNLFASLFDAKVERFIFGVDKVFRNVFVAKLRQDFLWRNCVVVIINHNQSLPPPHRLLATDKHESQTIITVCTSRFSRDVKLLHVYHDNLCNSFCKSKNEAVRH